MTGEETIQFVDGISAVTTQNGVHRIAFYRLSIEGKPSPCIELVIPDSSLRAMVDVLTKMIRPVKG